MLTLSIRILWIVLNSVSSTMRKLIFIISTLLLVAASCSDGPTYYQEYVVVTTFEYSGTDYSKTFGEDSTYFESTNGIGLSWGDLAFYHKVSSDKEFRGGFQLSYLKPSAAFEKPEGYTPNPYRAAGPVVSQTNRTYAVFSQTAEMPDHDIAFLSSAYGKCVPEYCWVNNCEAAYEVLKQTGENMTLTAKGYLGDQLTGTAEIKLAADTVMYNWTKFNLKPLGEIDHIDFELTAGPSVPQHFCLDELKADIVIQY